MPNNGKNPVANRRSAEFGLNEACKAAADPWQQVWLQLRV